jgi:hypothetical protein
MSATYGGMQAEIVEQQPNTPYIPCGADNLNFDINYSVMNISELATFMSC